MKKIAIIIVIILLISIAWFSWNTMTKKEVVEETPEQVLDMSTQTDTTDEIEVKIDNLDADLDLSEDFNGVDAEIKAI